MSKSKISPCLWFDGQAEEAASFYASLLPDSHVDAVHRAAAEYPSGKKGDVLTVEFTVAGRTFVGLNGGPHFKFNEAVSFQLYTDDQAETDRLTDALSAVPEAEQCGWVKDRFGLSWQIVPRRMLELMSDPDPARAKRAMDAMMQMKRIDIAAVERAADGRLNDVGRRRRRSGRGSVQRLVADGGVVVFLADGGAVQHGAIDRCVADACRRPSVRRSGRCRRVSRRRPVRRSARCRRGAVHHRSADRSVILADRLGERSGATTADTAKVFMAITLSFRSGQLSHPGARLLSFVGRVDQRDARGSSRMCGPMRFGDVAEADARVRVGEAERAAGAGVAEGARAGAEARVGAVLRQHEAEAEARVDLQDQIGAARLLLGAARDAGGVEDVHAVEVAAARQRAVDARQVARAAVAVGAGDLGAAPLGVVHAERHRRRVDEGARGHALGIGRGSPARGRSRRRSSSSDGIGSLISATRSCSAVGEADVQVEPERAGDLVAEVRAEAAARDAPHHLADQPAEGDGVVAVRRAGLPPRLLRGQRGAHRVPVVERLGRQRARAPPAAPARWLSSQRTGMRALPRLRELRPVRRHRRVEIEPSALDELVRAQRRHAPSCTSRR